MPPDPRSLERLPLLAGFVRADDVPWPATPPGAPVRAARWFRGAWELRARVIALPDVAARRAHEAAGRQTQSLALPWSSPDRIVVSHPMRYPPVPPAERPRRIRQTRAYLERRGVRLDPPELEAVALPRTPPAFVRVASGTVLIEVSGSVHYEAIRRGRARASSDPGPARMDAAVLALARALAREVPR